MRVQKLKTNTAVRGSLKHAFRTIDTPNADPSREGENTHIGAQSQEEAMTAYKELLPDKVRKNGVRCLEYLMTASPEKMNEMNREEQDAYFKDCRAWLEDMHGKDQVFYAGVHRDETTPHMYAYVVPLSQERDDDGNLVKPGKLNAREFIGGKSTRMSELQTEFAEKVGKAHGMERGVKGSKAKHQTVKSYYRNLSDIETRADKATEPKTLHEQETKGRGLVGNVKGLVNNIAYKRKETSEEVIARLASEAGRLSAGAGDLQRALQRETAKTKALNKELKELDAVRSLPPAERAEIIEQAKTKKETPRKRQQSRGLER